SSPSAGLIWMVASREICVCQVVAVSRTSVTPPSVRQERKVMMPMTSTMARDATLSGGTMGLCLGAGFFAACWAMPVPRFLIWARAGVRLRELVINFQPSAGQHHAPCIHLVHKAQIMRGDHHGRAHPV